MASTTRNLLVNGAALSAAAAIMAAAPAVVPGHVAGLPTPTQLSMAQYELTALTDISIQGISDALTNGWGGFIGAGDPFYPGVFTNDAKVTGILGAAYYLIDNSVGAFVPFNLDNYFFEVGSQSGNALLGGLGAAAYVGVGSIFGADSVPAQLVKTLVGGGSVDLGSAILQLTAGIPVIRDLASVYFTGQAVGGTTDYGTGFAGLLNYANTLLPGLAQLGGLTGVISAVTGFIGGIFGGRDGWGHDDEDDDHDHKYSSSSDDDDDDDDDDDEYDDDDDDHRKHWAASVVSAAGPAAQGPKAAATANSAASVGSPAVAAVEVAEATEVAATEVAGTEVASTEAPGTEVEVSAPKVDATDVAASDNAGAATEAAPKRSATRGGASKGAEKAGSSHDGKRAKVSRAS